MAEPATSPNGIDIRRFQGIARFGRAYEAMLERDTHTPNSVDRILTGTMIELCDETVEFLYSSYTPLRVDYEPGSRPGLERLLKRECGEAGSRSTIAAFARFCARLACDDETPIDSLVFGGTEEQIIERVTDWCTDLARVACVLLQIGGLPSRIVYLFNTGAAYSGHAIVETHLDGVWGAVDAVHGVVYAHGDGRAASAWDLKCSPDLIPLNWDGRETNPSKIGQFSGVAIANYFVWETQRHDFSVSGPNEYCKSILRMSEAGWPGGLRWLHAEDAIPLR